MVLWCSFTLKLSYNKCNVLQIESLKDTNFQLCCNQENGQKDVSGIHIPGNMEHITQENLNIKLQTVD